MELSPTMFLKKLAVALALTTGLAAEPAKNPLPNPLGYVDAGCVSFAVMHARADDVAFHKAMLTFWAELGKRQLDSSTWVGTLATFLSQTQQQQLLLGFLPFQGIRLDYLDKSGAQHSATVITVSGWKGLQGLFWNRLLVDPQGNPWPVKKVGRAEVALRNGGAITRLDGTFYAFSDTLMAQRCLVPSGSPVPTLYNSLDSSHDTYGLLYNRQRSLRRFLAWLDMDDVAAVEKTLGPEKFRKAMESVEFLTWQGELLDDDRLSLDMRLHADKADDIGGVEELVTVARRVLKDRGRPAEMQTKIVGADVMLNLVIGGNRRFFLDYLTRKEPI